MSTLNIDEIITAYGQGTGDLVATRKARAELAALRAKADELDHIRTLILWAVLQKWQSVYDAVDATIAEQARQLEQAREAIQPFATIGDVFVKQDPNDNSIWTKLPDNQMISIGWSHLIVTINDLRRASAWLSANAPQAQPAQDDR